MTRGGLAADGALAAKVGAAALASWLLPERTWPLLLSAVSRTQAAFGAVEPAARTSVDEEIARRTGRSVDSMERERVVSGYGARMWALREYVRPQKQPPIDVIGRDHLDRALSAGNGVILWVGRFTWSTIITKVGLHGAGYSVVHLSRSIHGFGESPFAVARLNPIWTRIEERFLEERIVLEPGAETASLREIRRRLGDGGVVSITVGRDGARTVSVPLFGGRMVQATGLAGLAASTGAPLLPVFTVAETSRRFRLEVEPPLELPGEGSRDRRDRDVAEQLAARTEAWVLRYPGQWLG